MLLRYKLLLALATSPELPQFLALGRMLNTIVKHFNIPLYWHIEFSQPARATEKIACSNCRICPSKYLTMVGLFGNAPN